VGNLYGAGQTLREDRPVAGPLVAEEYSYVQANGDGNPLPGQVGERSPVPGVNSGELLCAQGQRTARDEVLAARVMAFSVARMPIRFSSLEVGRTVREFDTGTLGDLMDLLCCQDAAPLHRKLRRTTFADRSELSDHVP
jgi:hypothetical protein